MSEVLAPHGWIDPHDFASSGWSTLVGGVALCLFDVRASWLPWLVFYPPISFQDRAELRYLEHR